MLRLVVSSVLEPILHSGIRSWRFGAVERVCKLVRTRGAVNEWSVVERSDFVKAFVHVHAWSSGKEFVGEE